MAGIRTLTITPAVGVQREAVTLASAVDFQAPGLSDVLNRGQRPAYKFNLVIEALKKQQVDSFSAFHFFHMGGKSFYWDACQWGYVTSHQMVSNGLGYYNTGRREFFLANRNIDANSCSIVIDRDGVRSVTTAFSLQAVPGIITLATAVQSGQDVLAAHAHKYKVKFDPEGLKIANQGAGLYVAELFLIETYI